MTVTRGYRQPAGTETAVISPSVVLLWQHRADQSDERAAVG
jgi:hypothetical protein